MPADRPIEPREVAELVERYVSKELADESKYENRTPLDGSGVYSLHCLAAQVYALGFAAGEDVERVRRLGDRAREADHAG